MQPTGPNAIWPTANVTARLKASTPANKPAPHLCRKNRPSSARNTPVIVQLANAQPTNAFQILH